MPFIHVTTSMNRLRASLAALCIFRLGLLLAGPADAARCASCGMDTRAEWHYCPWCTAPIGGFAVATGDAGNLLIGVEGPTAKVYREPASFRGLRTTEAAFSLARNEYEAVQVVLFPVPRGVTRATRSFTWEMSDLTSKSGRLPASRVSISPVGYVTPRPQYYGQDYTGAHPDPLAPDAGYRGGAVQVREGELQPLWVLLFAPTDTPPGEYRGTLTIKEGGRAVAQVMVRPRVRTFALPSAMHLPAAFDFYGIREQYPRRPGEFAPAWEKRLAGIEEACYRDMLAHRISPIRNLGYPQFLGSENGTPAFDFTEFDQNYKKYIEELHQPRFAVAPEWPGWGTGNFEAWKPNAWVGFRTTAALKATFGAICAHLGERGWLEKAYVYSIDEHPGQWTRDICARIHEACPKLKNLLTIMVADGYPEADIWCPRMYELTPERLALGKRFQREGKELWVYTSSPRPPFPTLVIDWDLINCRIIPWMCWKFGLNGYLSWCINFWKGNPWDDPGCYMHQNGNGFLYYPGAEGVVGSLRLEAFRDGLEDYEYLWLLRECVRRCEGKGEGGNALREATALLGIEDSVVRYFDRFTYDPRMVYTMRERVAACIEELGGDG